MVSVDDYRDLSAAAMSEDELLRAVVTMAQQLNYLVYHALPARTRKGWRTSTMGHIGWPDLALARDPYMGKDDGRFIIVELKSSRGRLSEHQELWLDVLRDCGIECHIWKPIDLVDGTIHRVLSGTSAVTAATVDDVRGIAPDMTVNPWEDEG